MAVSNRQMGNPTSNTTEEYKPIKPQESLLSDMKLPLRKMLYPLGYAVEIITNDPDVLEAANESFGHARFRRECKVLKIHVGVSDGVSSECPPEPTRRQYNHLYSLVADVDNQALLDLTTCTSFVWLTKATVNNRLYLRYNFLEKAVYLLLGASVVTDLHAACVSKNGKGILLCGDSGAGKSTLSYACARAGWTYTSDDTSYLINDAESPRVIGHSHRVRFRPAAKALFPELEDRSLTPRLEGKPSIEVPTSELPVLMTQSEATVDSIVYLKRYPSARGMLIRLPAGTATERACGELYSAGEIREKHKKILVRLSEIPTYELRYCNLSDAIQLLDFLVHGK
ncbi:aldolase [Acidicapsa acidisoli]|uniref:aldolase n=1 Tax=Acidicapsa acidisoli TaxID=1615681 RepID=UPI0021E0AD5A|nr:aldolase [Acidicapsa acidisoli]